MKINTKYKKTRFGKMIEHRLVDLDEGHKWLIGELRSRGYKIDEVRLNKLMTGDEHKLRRETICALCRLLDLKVSEYDAEY